MFGSWPAMFGRGHWKEMRKPAKSCSGKNSCRSTFKRAVSEHQVTTKQKMSSWVVTATCRSSADFLCLLQSNQQNARLWILPTLKHINVFFFFLSYVCRRQTAGKKNAGPSLEGKILTWGLWESLRTLFFVKCSPVF